MALNAPSGPENRVNIIAQLEDAEGNPAGPQLDLPHDADPKQLEEVLNALLQNEDKVPFAFYAADAEITGTLGEHLRKRDASVESVLKIVYQPQALFRVRPVTRCSSTIPGHAEAVLSVAFSPDGKHLASGSGDTTVRMWNHETETPRHTCAGHANWVLCIAWSPDGRYVASGGMDKDVRMWDPESGAGVGGPMRGHKKHVTALAWEPAHVRYPPFGWRRPRRHRSGVERGAQKLRAGAHGATNSVPSVKWGARASSTALRDTTVMVWTRTPARWCVSWGATATANTLALSSGPQFEPGRTSGQKARDDETAKAKALEYKAATGEGRRITAVRRLHHVHVDPTSKSRCGE